MVRARAHCGGWRRRIERWRRGDLVRVRVRARARARVRVRVRARVRVRVRVRVEVSHEEEHLDALGVCRREVLRHRAAQARAEDDRLLSIQLPLVEGVPGEG